MADYDQPDDTRYLRKLADRVWNNEEGDEMGAALTKALLVIAGHLDRIATALEEPTRRADAEAEHNLALGVQAYERMREQEDK